MAKVLVVEDNILHAENIEMHLENLEYEIQAICENAEDALLCLSTGLPDIILLDIHLDGITDGIELAEKINRVHQIPIIFTTSMFDDGTVDRASKTNPEAYLLKPINELSLKISLQLALKKRGDLSKQVFDLSPLKNETSTNSSIESVFVKVGRLLKRINLAEVDVIISAEDKYCDLVDINDQVYSVRTSLQQIQEKLPKHFLRVHRSHICNMNNVKRIDEQFGIIKLHNREISMGKSYKSQVIDFINKIG
jgi:DNA-binding LytR/AlgR family response regulator